MVVFEVPLLPPDQERAQSVNNFVDAFINLQNAVEHIFTTINTKIENTAKRVDDLKHRAAVAQAKVDHLRGADKATQVFCSAVYPGSTELRYQYPLFSDDEMVSACTTITRASRQSTPAALQDHGEFFHVRSSGAKLDMFGQPVTSPAVGKAHPVKPLPAHLNSISSLLLFGSNSNLYKDKKRPRGGKRSKPRTGDIEPAPLDDAPSTLTEGDLADLISQDEFQYLPDLSDLPELDMPTDLPALTGLANDLMFDGSSGAGIAPSVGMLPATILPSNTSVPPPISTASSAPGGRGRDAPTPDARSSSKTDVSISAVAASTTTTTTSMGGAPPPPPPPPPPQAILNDEVDRTTAATAADAAAADAPQTVPAAVLCDARGELMKAIQQAGGSSKAKLKHVKTKKNSAASSSPHSDLMHAIEETGGGATLRHVEPQPKHVEEPSNPHSQLMQAIQQAGGSQKANLKKVEPAQKKAHGPDAAPAGGGNLMADLFARLSQRRKGISGASKVEGSDSEAVNPKQKMAPLIPPPPLGPMEESESGKEDGDEDDWN